MTKGTLLVSTKIQIQISWSPRQPAAPGRKEGNTGLQGTCMLFSFLQMRKQRTRV